jgi:hypothetical protein
MKFNKEWHESHLMPKNPSLDQRIKWHIEHYLNCDCHTIPENLQEEIKKRSLHLDVE